MFQFRTIKGFSIRIRLLEYIVENKLGLKKREIKKFAKKYQSRIDAKVDAAKEKVKESDNNR